MRRTINQRVNNPMGAYGAPQQPYGYAPRPQPAPQQTENVVPQENASEADKTDDDENNGKS